MPLPYPITINGITYFTIRGSVSESRASGILAALPRKWDATLDILTDTQEDNIRWCMSGIPVVVTFPNGDNVARAIVMATDWPIVRYYPSRKPIQVSVTIEEFPTSAV